MKKLSSPYLISISLLLLALLTGMGAFSQTVSAQDAGVLLTFGSPQTDAFPLVRFFFEPFASDGTKINEVNPADMQVIEDGVSVPVVEVNRYQPGLQLTLAMNVTPDLNQAIGESTFYHGIQTALVGWAKKQPADSPDELTLTVNAGHVLSRARGPEGWASTLETYQPDFEGSVSSLQSLIAALDAATDTLSNAYMRRAILFITTKPTPEMQSALPNLTARAAQQGVQVSVWLVSPGSNPDENDVNELRDLVDLTGGELFIFTNLTRSPDYEAVLLPLRYLFQLGYRSMTGASGEHTVTAVLANGEQRITSEAMTYTIELKPANAIFIQPPGVIARTRQVEPSAGSDDDDLTPSHYTLQVVYDFPDGHPRAITEAVLYANGAEVLRNTQPPFDQFDWDISGIQATTEMGLQVKARDELGLTGESQIVTTIVEVEPKQQTWLADMTNEFGVIPIIVAAFGGVLLLILLAAYLIRRLAGRRNAPRKASIDPLTQPVFIQQEGVPAARVPASTDIKSTRQLPRARLIKVSGDEENRVSQVFLISKPIYTFGSSPEKATCILDFPSVESVQARLMLQQDGSDLLLDQSKNSGTWVNYSPVPSIGTHLKDGDLIHFGRLIYRYEIINQANELTIPVKAK